VLVAWTDPSAVVLRLRCSKGTYVRSLAFDLGRALGTGAHLTALRRTRSGPFHIDEAHPLAAVESAPLIGLSQALGHLPTVRAGSDDARRLEQGKRVSWTVLEPADTPPPQGRFQVLRPDGSLLAVAELRDDDTLHTLRVFN
jgi:tRNA pseudouridine55 synthase